LKSTLLDAEVHGATEGSFRESKRPKKYFGYSAYMTKLIEAEPSTFEEAIEHREWKAVFHRDSPPPPPRGLVSSLPRAPGTWGRVGDVSPRSQNGGNSRGHARETFPFPEGTFPHAPKKMALLIVYDLIDLKWYKATHVLYGDNVLCCLLVSISVILEGQYHGNLLDHIARI